MKKLKTLNYKILSTLPVISVCLATTQQTSSAMLRSSFSRVLQTSSKNTITTNTSTQTVKYLYRSGSRVPVLDSNPLKNTNPNSSFSIKNSSVNPPTASTNIYRNSRTLSVIGNDILQNNSSHVPLNLTSKLTPYSPTNTQQQPVSNKPSISNIKSTTSPTSSITSNPDYSLELSETGKKLGILLGNALKPILELSARTTFYGIKNNSNDISSLINSNKSYKNESSKWGNILSTVLVARLQVDAINNNQNSTTLSKK